MNKGKYTHHVDIEAEPTDGKFSKLYYNEQLNNVIRQIDRASSLKLLFFLLTQLPWLSEWNSKNLITFSVTKTVQATGMKDTTVYTALKDLEQKGVIFRTEQAQADKSWSAFYFNAYFAAKGDLKGIMNARAYQDNGFKAIEVKQSEQVAEVEAEAQAIAEQSATPEQVESAETQESIAAQVKQYDTLKSIHEALVCNMKARDARREARERAKERHAEIQKIYTWETLDLEAIPYNARQ